MTFRSLGRVLSFVLLSTGTWAQGTQPTATPREGEIETGEIEIRKDRKIELPIQSRNFEKIPALPKDKTQREKPAYRFTDRNLTVAPPKFNPHATQPAQETNDEAGYDSNVRIGAGNYGRFLAEGNLNSRSDLPYGLNIKFLHNSTSQGPVDGRNSAATHQRLSLGGKYLTESFKLDGTVGLERDQFYFYGYRRLVEPPNRETIRQNLNRFSAGVGLENTRKEARIDYALRTNVATLGTRTGANELEWKSNFRATFPISEKFSTHLTADAYVGQRTDSLTNNRNLYRVRPTFQYRTDVFSITAGINAVHETDNRNALRKATHGYPVVNLDIEPFDDVHFFAGYEGDVVRNTLSNFLAEKQFLDRNVQLLNTEKNRDIYLGSKGLIGTSFNYEARVSYTGYRNFYVFNNARRDTSRFAILYDEPGGTNTGLTNVVQVSAQVGYQHQDWWTSLLKVDAYSYDLRTLERAWHRPSINATWNNTLTFREKLIVNTDFYLTTGLAGRNPYASRRSDLPAIVDLNFKTTYLLTSQLSGFVSINNILGTTYQRYLYYPQQGLNFLVGVAYSF
jgi:hypothetical protein